MATGPLSLAHHVRWLVGEGTAEEITDAQLLERFRTAREEAAFALLVHRHGPLVWRVCLRVLRHAQDAEDAFQATFLVLARKAGTIHKSSSVGSWLYGVALRTATRARARNGRRCADLPLEEAHCPARPDDAPAALQQRELEAALDEELNGLPDRYRLPLLLCYLDDQSTASAAERLGWPAGTFKSRLVRARELLGARLRRRGLALSAPALAALLAEGAAGAPPAGLVRSTARAAPAFAAGRTPNAASPSALKLATRMIRPMLTPRLAVTTLAALMLGLLGLGAGLVPSTSADRQEAAHAAAPPGRPARTDLHGDPLPAGALARLGTVRWRHPDGVTLLAFLPDSKIVSAGHDHVVRLWASDTGREVRRLRVAGAGTDRFSVCLALAPDGKTVAVGDYAGTIRLWALDTGKERGKIEGAKAPRALLFTPDGKVLLSRPAGSHVLQAWDVATGKERRFLEKPPYRAAGVFGLSEMDVSPDGKTLAAATSEGGPRAVAVVTLFDLATGKVVRTLHGPLLGFHWPSTRFTPDGKAVAWEGDTGSVTLADVATGKVLRRFGVASAERGSVAFAFAPDGKTLFTFRPAEQAVRVWDVASGKQPGTLGKPAGAFGHPGQNYGSARLAVSRDGKSLAVTHGQNAVRVFDLPSGKERAAFAGHPTSIVSVQYTSGGKAVLTRSWDGTQRVWDAATGKELRQIAAPEDATHLIVSSDERFLASYQRDRSVRVVNVATGKVTLELKATFKNLYGCSFSPNGRVLGVRDVADHKLYFFDPATGKKARTAELPDPQDPRVMPAGSRAKFAPQADWPGPVFSPDGNRVAVPVTYQRLGLWDRATGQPLTAFDLEAGEVSRSAAFSADGRSLAVAVNDGTVRLFEVATGKQRRRYGTPGKPPARNSVAASFEASGWYSGIAGTLAFSRDGRFLAQGGPDSFVRLWDVTSGKLAGKIEGHQGPVPTIAFSPDGRTFATGSFDTTALVWDVRSLPSRPEGKLTAKELAKHWGALAGADAGKAFDAVGALASAPSRAVPYLRERLRPVAPVDPGKVKRLANELGSADFKERERAFAKLSRVAEGAAPVLEKLLEGKPELEVRRRLTELLAQARGRSLTGEALRELRAVEALERAGTAEARALLKALAGGAPGARLTRAAGEALGRP
jgi:RNA polymerase sigma factor (sigma-70 family)